MKMRRIRFYALTIVCFLLSVNIFASVHSDILPSSMIDYALIIGGSHMGLPVAQTTYFVEWVLLHVFNMSRDHIIYLLDDSEPLAIPSYVTYNFSATKTNVRYYVRQWLASMTGSSSNPCKTLIYVFSHGGGFDVNSGEFEGEARWNDGNEFLVNGTLRGVDETIMLTADNSSYWDTELKEDISSFQPYNYPTVVLQTCKMVNDTSGLSCFSGGFIGDLSGNYRTIITASNETGWSMVAGSVAEFTDRFMSAFSNYRIVFDGSFTHFDYGSPINWTYKSWRGAFEYALQNDPHYRDNEEFPWFDDDGDGLPGWVNNTEMVLFPQNGQDLMRWLRHDLTGPDGWPDGKVDIRDISFVAKACFTSPGNARWNKQADAYQDWKINIADISAVARDFGKTT